MKRGFTAKQIREVRSRDNIRNWIHSVTFSERHTTTLLYVCLMTIIVYISGFAIKRECDVVR